MKQRPKSIDEFIGSSKDSQVNYPRSEEKIDLGNLLSEKPKTFPLSIPPSLHRLATELASKQFPKISLHDYILVALKEKIEREEGV